MCGEYIKVHILDVPYHADREYTYYVPLDFRADIEIGSMVVVPFGKSDRHKSAIVCEAYVSEAPNNSQIKPIKSVLSSYLKLSEEMLQLCFFMKNRTLCTIGEAVKCIIPSAIMTKTEERYFVTEEEKKVEDYLKELYDFIADKNGVSYKKINDSFGDSQQYLTRLIRAGLVRKETFVEEKDKNKYEVRLNLAIPKNEALLIADGVSHIKLRSKKHGEILRLL